MGAVYREQSQRWTLLLWGLINAVEQWPLYTSHPAISQMGGVCLILFWFVGCFFVVVVFQLFGFPPCIADVLFLSIALVDPRRTNTPGIG